MGPASCTVKTPLNHILTQNGIPPGILSMTDTLYRFPLARPFGSPLISSMSSTRCAAYGGFLQHPPTRCRQATSVLHSVLPSAVKWLQPFAGDRQLSRRHSGSAPARARRPICKMLVHSSARIGGRGTSHSQDVDSSYFFRDAVLVGSLR